MSELKECLRKFYNDLSDIRHTVDILEEKLEQETKRRKEAEKVALSFNDHLETCSIFIYDDKGCNCGYQGALKYQTKHKEQG